MIFDRTPVRFRRDLLYKLLFCVVSVIISGSTLAGDCNDARSYMARPVVVDTRQDCGSARTGLGALSTFIEVKGMEGLGILLTYIKVKKIEDLNILLFYEKK